MMTRKVMKMMVKKVLEEQEHSREEENYFLWIYLLDNSFENILLKCFSFSSGLSISEISQK